MKKTALVLCVLSAIAYLAFGEDRRTSTVYYMEGVDWGIGPLEKPYIHQNPNNDHWICSKHGNLTIKNGLPVYDTRVTVRDTRMMYCTQCFWETISLVIGEHITGVKK